MIVKIVDVLFFFLLMEKSSVFFIGKKRSLIYIQVISLDYLTLQYGFTICAYSSTHDHGVTPAYWWWFCDNDLYLNSCVGRSCNLTSWNLRCLDLIAKKNTTTIVTKFMIQYPLIILHKQILK